MKPVFHESDLGYALISLEIFAALYRDAPGIFCARERERERESVRAREKRKKKTESMKTLLSSTCYENMFSVFQKKEKREITLLKNK